MGGDPLTILEFRECINIKNLMEVEVESIAFFDNWVNLTCIRANFSPNLIPSPCFPSQND